MKIFKPYGSKDRLFEMMQRVNKIKLNEDESITKDNAIINGFNTLKNGNLEKENGGSKQVTVDSSNGENKINITAQDIAGNMETKEIKVTYQKD